MRTYSVNVIKKGGFVFLTLTVDILATRTDGKYIAFAILPDKFFPLCSFYQSASSNVFRVSVNGEISLYPLYGGSENLACIFPTN